MLLLCSQRETRLYILHRQVLTPPSNYRRLHLGTGTGQTKFLLEANEIYHMKVTPGSDKHLLFWGLRLVC